MLMPTVETPVKIGGFLLRVYAYRKVTKLEAQLAGGQWLKENKRKTYPKHGEGKVLTIFGFEDL